MKLPQLSLRDLFWLVLVVGCLCGWWIDRTRLNAIVDKLSLPVFENRAVQGPAVNPKGVLKLPTQQEFDALRASILADHPPGKRP